MDAPKQVGIIWGWALLDNGVPEYIEFKEYEGDDTLHSVNPEYDYMIAKDKIAMTKNQLLEEQIAYCRGHRDRWEHSMKWFESLKDPERIEEPVAIFDPDAKKSKPDSAEDLVECPACNAKAGIYCPHCRDLGWMTKFGEKMYYVSRSQGF